MHCTHPLIFCCFFVSHRINNSQCKATRFINLPQASSLQWRCINWWLGCSYRTTVHCRQLRSLSLVWIGAVVDTPPNVGELSAIAPSRSKSGTISYTPASYFQPRLALLLNMTFLLSTTLLVVGYIIYILLFQFSTLQTYISDTLYLMFYVVNQTRHNLCNQRFVDDQHRVL